ncbi:MAG TPA: bifunctional (p)ppGpp synthetase/guanosine-3',5'-bis(diphosphate) 3'-pyrophosphohydrolase [Actinomycetes bacterium]|jgi:GTP pyrophosphokinase|nr:bifunctional (p)ppGpp synthetase/guanosine-3',5'-bis(diphosphate) 3'-pyrophosphohydrolase [Actinomycetes bacterium]
MAQHQRAAVPDGRAVGREPSASPTASGRNGAAGDHPSGLALTRLRPYDSRPPPEPDVEPLLRKMKHRNPKADLVLVRRAYEVAWERHGGQARKSGLPYIAHPLGVATIVADLGLDTISIIAALLHDVVEDTSMTLEEVEGQFGPEVAKITDGLTKLDRIGFETREAAQAETIRKMVIAMARDIRVLLIKLADRLHNMRDIGYLPREKQERKARETLEIYAPLANRLGMHQVKWELEDLAFAALFPKRYEEIVRMTTERQPEREHYIANVIEQVNAQLRALKVRAEVTGRPKHYYSIYEKMVLRGKEFSDIFDLVGVRVLTDSIKDCYAALGQVHALWKPVPGRFKDYIAMPKFNLYQSLHTTVVGPEGKPLEIQIRTKAMHQTAEYGIAAHWRYKARDAKGNPTEQEMGWLRQLIDWQRELSDPKDFIDNLKTDLYVDEVFVFTPKGDVLQLPAGATPIDFAYSVHTEVGHRCVGARVNKRLVPLEYALQNGDTVEIFTSKAPDAGPSRDWLAIVKTPRARNKIRQWFSKERREDAIEAGKESLVRAMRKAGLPLQRLTQSGALAALASEMRFPTLDGLYAAVGSGQVTAPNVVSRLQADLGEEEQEDEDLPLRRATRPVRPLPSSRGVVVKGVEDVWVKLARCCTPVPRDPIIGFVTRGHGVSVHRSDCPNAADLRRHPNRMIEVSWDTSGPSVFAVTIQVEALDRTKLLRDITEVLSDHHVNIVSATVATGRDRIATLRFTFELADISHLAHVLSSVKRVDAVYDAFRVVPHGNDAE